MRKTFPLITAAAAVLAFAAQLFAGGFWLVLGNPEASAQARAMSAVVTVKAAGCHDPAKASIDATAIGIVNGQRRSLPLKLAPIGEPGMFALTRQWPSEGRWVIQLVGHNQGAVTHTLVAAGPEGVDRLNAKLAVGPPADQEIDAMLHTTVARK